MVAVTSASLYMTLISIVLSVSDGQTNITAEPGQTVPLPCEALNNDPVIAVEWRRTDMKEEEDVLLYRDGRFVNDNQHPSYQNRVDLQDRQMKDGDVSLILKNVKIEDSGTYECRVKTKTTRSIINSLEVVPPGGDKGDGGVKERGDKERGDKERGDKDGGDMDGGDMDGGDKDGGDKDGSVGLIVGLIVAGVVLIAAISLITIRHMKKKSSPPPSSPSLQSADQTLV